ncbi:hypothetical protein ACFCYX_08290 [Streptomyces populi]|nr:hypothetical protein [Streptomyces populi]
MTDREFEEYIAGLLRRDGGVTAVHRGLLEEWSTGTALAVLE